MGVVVGGAFDRVAGEEGRFFGGVFAEVLEDLEELVDGVGAVGDA